MAKNYKEIRQLNMPIDSVINKLRNISYSGITPAMYEETQIPNGMQISFSSGTSLSSWGENITITMITTIPNITQVTIYSESALSTTLLDWGKNKSNVITIFDFIIS